MNRHSTPYQSAGDAERDHHIITLMGTVPCLTMLPWLVSHLGLMNPVNAWTWVMGTFFISALGFWAAATIVLSVGIAEAIRWPAAILVLITGVAWTAAFTLIPPWGGRSGLGFFPPGMVAGAWWLVLIANSVLYLIVRAVRSRR